MVRERDEEERQPWGPRLLAPLAFFTAVVILVLLVNSSLSSDTEGSTTPTNPPAATGNTTTGGTTTTATGRRRFYRIREGDTLEAIAERFDTTVDDLLQLNPGIDANSLTPGQRIRIR
jgi:LysM repeat protein